MHQGDTIIVLSYATVSEDEARRLEPRLVYVDGQNRIVRTGHAIQEPVPA